MMTYEEFEQIISLDPALAAPVHNAVASIPRRRGDPFGTPTDATFLIVLFFILREIGLPWACEIKRYAELWRLRFHNWIDEQYHKHGINPEDAETVGKALRRELDTITDVSARKSWERLSTLIQESNSNLE